MPKRHALSPDVQRFTGVAELIHALRRNPSVSAALVAFAFVSNLTVLVVDEMVRGAFTLFLLVPIILAGLSFGIYGGLLSGILAAVFIAYLAPWNAVGALEAPSALRVDWGVRAVWFCAVGALVGVLAESSRFMLGQVNHLRGIDPATGLPDFDAAHKQIEVLLSGRPGDGADPDVHVTQVRVTNFDQLRTRYGNRRVEQIMRQLRERIRVVMPAKAFVSRSEADEFTVVESGDPSWSADDRMQRLSRMREDPFEVDGMMVHADLVAATASVERSDEGAAAVLSRARSKLAGGAGNPGSACGAGLAGVDRAPADLRLLGDVGQAIESGEIRVVYQPALNLHSRRFAKLEALSRWSHPTRGLIPPSKFIPLIDHSNMFHIFTRWIFDEVVDQLGRWHADGYDPAVFVNLTPRNLMDRSLLVELPQLLKKRGLSLKSLGIEISERYIMSLKGKQLDYLRQLKSMGLHCVVDQFVGDRVPLTHLRTLPVDTIKLDAAQLCVGSGRLKDADTLRTIVNMAHDLGLAVSVGGVETEVQLSEFVALGCDELQGYLLARPMEHDQVVGVIGAHYSKSMAGAESRTG